MSILEKVSYIKGLAEGVKLDAAKDEGKVLYAIIDALSEIAEEIELLNEDYEGLVEFTDEINDALEQLEEEVYADDEYCDDDDFVLCPECGAENYLSFDDYDKGTFICSECEKEFAFDDEEGGECCENCRH